jgi:alpha-tubulin suppressor-like RCC1 family protein
MNAGGQLGRRTGIIPDPNWAPVPGIDNATGVACGHHSTIVVLKNGNAVAFGSNLQGELGIPPHRHLNRDGTIFPVRLHHNIIAVTFGFAHTLWLLGDGTVVISGLFLDALYGVPPAVVEGLENVISIAAGTTHNAVVTADRRVATWGENTSGQLGRGYGDEAIPTFLHGINDAHSVACGEFMTAIVHQNGTVSTFGEGGPALGLGEEIQRQDTPERIPGLENVIAVSVSTVGPKTIAL